MKVAKLLKTFALLSLLIGLVVTFWLGIKQSIALESLGVDGATRFGSVLFYYVIGIPSSLISFGVLYGFANIVDYCEKRA